MLPMIGSDIANERVRALREQAAAQRIRTTRRRRTRRPAPKR